MSENKTSYFELLRHPNWQKKRLEVLALADYECENCGSKEKTLHVHHTYYEKGLKPWQYPTESLRCLCEECHKETQAINTLIKRQLGKIELSDDERLLGYMFALETGSYPMVTIDVMSYEIAQGIGDYWRITPEVIIDNLQEGKIDGWKLHDLSKNNG